MNELGLRNRQRLRAVHLALLRRIIRALLADLLPAPRYELGICLVNAADMARLNRQFLQHAGPTDVITFDYTDDSPDLRACTETRLGASSSSSSSSSSSKGKATSRTRTTTRTTTRTYGRSGVFGHDPKLHGDLFICVEEAIRQARQFRTTWQAELVRYVVHGILHLRGYDDAAPDCRRVMKREEDRLTRRLAARFRLSALGGQTRVGA
ncbi:MAG: rRNA maturation RNase YbeY [Chloroflexi bacterium]|nr:rRNA maturation RNase YbeY [Chloroflexota bacterium]